MKKYINIENSIPIIFQILLLLIWQLVVDYGHIPKYILASPKDIFLTLIQILPGLKQHIYVTLKEAFLGLGVSIILSIVIVIFMDTFKIIKKVIYPTIIVSQTIPIIALAPLFVMWFGFGTLPKVIVVVLVCFFPIVVSLLDGLENVDKDIINLLRSMGATKLQIFKLVKFPASIISFFSGLRIAATYSIMGAIIGEWLGGEKGLGVYMLRVKHSFAVDKVFAVTIVIVVLSMIFFGILFILQYLLTPWVRVQKDKNN